MKILVDEEGKKALMSLVDVAVRAGGFGNSQAVMMFISAIQPLPTPKKTAPAEEKPCSE